MVQKGVLREGIGVDDGAAAHFIDEQLIRVVSSRPEARGYRLLQLMGNLREEVLDTQYIG
jgi:hypothetical protein